MRDFLFLLFFSFTFVSCGKVDLLIEKGTNEFIDQFKASSSKAQPEIPLYQYELKDESCTTGFHEYETLPQVCVAILDDKLNNNCLRDKRLEYYASSCSI